VLLVVDPEVQPENIGPNALIAKRRSILDTFIFISKPLKISYVRIEL
jgi:hypothetical protein